MTERDESNRVRERKINMSDKLYQDIGVLALRTGLEHREALIMQAIALFQDAVEKAEMGMPIGYMNEEGNFIEIVSEPITFAKLRAEETRKKEQSGE